MIKHFPLNAVGRDFVVGDVHGCFDLLITALTRVEFDETVDRLFSVGDLVDRGPESAKVLEWLDKPWFHAVRGNHEQMALDYESGFTDGAMYCANGGAWFIGMMPSERAPYVDAFKALPIAIEVESQNGLIGIVHADCPVNDWADLHDALTGDNAFGFTDMCMWSRARIASGRTDVIGNVHQVYVGHTPVQEVQVLGNVNYLDTGAVYGNGLTISQIANF